MQSHPHVLSEFKSKMASEFLVHIIFLLVLGFSNQKPAIPSVGCVDVFWKKFIEAMVINYICIDLQN